MTTVQQVYTIRSFRSSKDRDFPRALRIYDTYTHPQLKTDSREIAHWLDSNASRKEGRFFVCGLYTGADLVGYVEFIYLSKERLIHIDYFIIEPDRRTAGAFYTFADQMRAFFEEEKLEWDFVTGEIAELNPVNGVSKHAQGILRVFRQVGFAEVLTEYEQPLLGIDHPDTTMPARLVVLTRVEMESISKVRYLELISAIYRKHYGEWYSIYADTSTSYETSLDALIKKAEDRLRNKTEITLRGPERDFIEAGTDSKPPLREALYYVAKLILSAVAAGLFHQLLKHNTAYSFGWISGASACILVLLIVTVSLADRKRLEAFKILIALVGKFFDR